jgi:hypothetical protein
MMGTCETRTKSVSSLVYLLVAFVAFLVFLPWVGGYFLGDDWMLYARNSGRALPEQLQLISEASNSSQYRPMYELLLAWLWSLFGFNPIGHHVVNLTLHALNAVLVAALGQRLARDRRVSLLAGLSFAVFGCHTEAVVWMTARHEMIVTALALLSMISYIKFRVNGRHIWWASTFFLYIISFGFKETALALPLFLSFYDLLFAFPSKKSNRYWWPSVGQLIPLVPPIMVGLAYLLFRLKVGGGYDVPFTVLGPPKNLVYYLLMETVALPASTSFLSRFPLVTVPVIVSLAIACAVSVWLARDKIMRDRVARFGALWMVFGLAPVILIVAERTTYVSSVGWALAIASIVTLAWDAASQSNLPLKRWLTVLAMVVLLGANLVTLTHRSYWWDRAADISYDLFSQVRVTMLALPPGKSGQLWFINMPNRIEYAYTFGDRLLFAVWLLQEQAGVRGVEVSLFRDPESKAPPDNWTRQLLSEHIVEGPVVAFYWQDGKVVELSVPENALSP